MEVWSREFEGRSRRGNEPEPCPELEFETGSPKRDWIANPRMCREWLESIGRLMEF